MRLQEYDDAELSCVGLRMIVRHSWYLSPKLSSLAIFSNHVPDKIKVKLVAGMQQDRGSHLLTKLPGFPSNTSLSLKCFNQMKTFANSPPMVQHFKHRSVISAFVIGGAVSHPTSIWHIVKEIYVNKWGNY